MLTALGVSWALNGSNGSRFVDQSYLRRLDCAHHQGWSRFLSRLLRRIETGDRLADDKELLEMAEDLLQPWDHQPRGVFQQETTIFLSQLLGATETSEFCFPGYQAACWLRILKLDDEMLVESNAQHCASIFGKEASLEFLSSTSWPVRLLDLELFMRDCPDPFFGMRQAMTLSRTVESFQQFRRGAAVPWVPSGSVDPRGLMRKQHAVPPSVPSIRVTSVFGGHCSLWLEPLKPLSSNRSPSSADGSAPSSRMARSPRELTLLLALVTLGIVGLCIFLVNFDSEPIAGPPAWRFSVTLARVRAKAKETRIPQQLILTSKDGLMANLPLAVQRNVRHTMALNPWVRVRWFGDEDCKRYLLQYFNDTELPHFFSQEQRGSYRSDVCRAAVLAREGGFYTDLDVEMKWKFEDLAGNMTTFLASYSEDGSVLNAMMGCVANSSVVKEILQQLLRFYRGEAVERYGTTSEWMGPVTALAGLKAVANRDCPDQGLQPWRGAEILCGPHVFRMFEERQLPCWLPEDPDCPGSRYTSDFPGVKYGIYVPSGPLVAWPRFANCSEWGCLTGGWPSETPTQEVNSLWSDT